MAKTTNHWAPLNPSDHTDSPSLQIGLHLLPEISGFPEYTLSGCPEIGVHYISRQGFSSGTWQFDSETGRIFSIAKQVAKALGFQLIDWSGEEEVVYEIKDLNGPLPDD